MTPEERDLITGLFTRLQAADTPSKDREADDLIRRLIGQVPAAPYLLTQTALVQEEALKGAQAHIANLEQQLAEARQAAQPPANAGSFLSRVRRPWETPTPQGAPAQAAYAPPPGYAAPAYGAPAQGGFLHSALTTAAGVAGGALLFSGIERMLGFGGGPFGGYGGGYGTSFGSPWGGSATPSENVTVNNYYGDDASSQQGTQTGTDQTDNDPGYTDTSYDSDGGGGGDFGGGDSGGMDFT